MGESKRETESNKNKANEKLVSDRSSELNDTCCSLFFGLPHDSIATAIVIVIVSVLVIAVVETTVVVVATK